MKPVNRVVSRGKVSIEFGLLCEPIAKQLKSQGLKVTMWKYKPLQKAADDLAVLHIQGFIVSSELRRARQRLMKKVVTFLG